MRERSMTVMPESGPVLAIPRCSSKCLMSEVLAKTGGERQWQCSAGPARSKPRHREDPTDAPIDAPAAGTGWIRRAPHDGPPGNASDVQLIGDPHGPLGDAV